MASYSHWGGGVSNDNIKVEGSKELIRKLCTAGNQRKEESRRTVE